MIFLFEFNIYYDTFYLYVAPLELENDDNIHRYKYTAPPGLNIEINWRGCYKAPLGTKYL